MSFLFINFNLLLFLTMIFSVLSLKIKVNGLQKDYCFTKTIYIKEDTIKLFYLITSGKSEKLNVVLKNKDGTILFIEQDKQKGEYISDVLPQGEYTLCFDPRQATEYYISFDMQFGSETITKDLAEDKEVKSIKNGVIELETYFNDFEKNLKFIADRRNHHHTILENTVGNIKNISSIKILVIICLSLFQVFIITRFFGADKRVRNIKAGNKDFL